MRVGTRSDESDSAYSFSSATSTSFDHKKSYVNFYIFLFITDGNSWLQYRHRLVITTTTIGHVHEPDFRDIFAFVGKTLATFQKKERT